MTDTYRPQKRQTQPPATAASAIAATATLAHVLDQLDARPLAPGERKSERRRLKDSVLIVARLLNKSVDVIPAEADLFRRVELRAAEELPAHQARRYRIDFAQALRRSELVPILPPARICWPQDWMDLREAASPTEWKRCDHLGRYLILKRRAVRDVCDDDIRHYVDDHAKLVCWASAREIALDAIQTLNNVAIRCPSAGLKPLTEVAGKRKFRHPSRQLYPDGFWKSLDAYREFLSAPPPQDPYVLRDAKAFTDTRDKAVAVRTVKAHVEAINFLAATYVWGGGSPGDLETLRDLASEAAVTRLKAGMKLYTAGQTTTRCSSAFHILLLIARYWPEMEGDQAMLARLETAYVTNTPKSRIETRSTRKATTTFLDPTKIKMILAAPRTLWRLAPTCVKSTEMLALQQSAVAVRMLALAPQSTSDLMGHEVGVTLILPSGPEQQGRIFSKHHDKVAPKALPYELARLLCDYEIERQKILVRAGIDPRAERHLFITTSGRKKTAAIVSRQITEGLERVTGLRLTVAQLRFCAAVLSLIRDPNDTETPRQLLGHTSSSTTDARLGLAKQALAAKRVAAAIIAATSGADFEENDK
jgi:hypothetical protein